MLPILPDPPPDQPTQKRSILDDTIDACRALKQSISDQSITMTPEACYSIANFLINEGAATGSGRVTDDAYQLAHFFAQTGAQAFGKIK